jgi:hypothetical protein
VQLQSDLKLYRNQMDALEYVDSVLYTRPRRLPDLELALNKVEEYQLETLEEARALLRIREEMVSSLHQLEAACGGDDFSLVDAALTRCAEAGFDMAAEDKIKEARKTRELLFKQDTVARELIKTSDNNDIST